MFGRPGGRQWLEFPTDDSFILMEGASGQTPGIILPFAVAPGH